VKKQASRLGAKSVGGLRKIMVNRRCGIWGAKKKSKADGGYPPLFLLWEGKESKKKTGRKEKRGFKESWPYLELKKA